MFMSEVLIDEFGDKYVDIDGLRLYHGKHPMAEEMWSMLSDEMKQLSIESWKPYLSEPNGILQLLELL